MIFLKKLTAISVPSMMPSRCVALKRGIAQSGSAPALGAGCRGFESLYPDQLF
jgi:hypothetical protein